MTIMSGISPSFRLLLPTVRSAESKRGLSVLSNEKREEILRAEDVLSEKNQKLFVERFQRYKTGTKKAKNASQAAVLVPLCIHNGQVGILYTLRSLKMSVNRGQVSFPGGMNDKADQSLEETALRETWEELKIPKDKVKVWTSGNLIGKKNVNVMPIIGYIGQVEPEKLQINPDEVDEAFVVSLKNLCDPTLCKFTQFRDSYTLPVYLGGKHRIWGFTAAITHMVLNSLVPSMYSHRLQWIPSINAISKDNTFQQNL